MKNINFKSENGAITLFVLLAMLFFTTVSLTAFIATSNSATNQDEYIATIKDNYEKDLNNIDEIYAKLTGQTTSSSGVEVEIPANWKTTTAYTVKETDGTVVSKKAYASTVYAVSDGIGNTIPVPYGFYYVGGTLDTGVVISDNVADKYDGTTDKTTHAYSSQLQGNQFVWIPCSISDYKKIDWGKENAKWDMETNTAETTQIEKYGGFYIGRYEAGVSTLDESTNTFKDSVTFANNASLFNSVEIQTGINTWVWQNYNFTARQTGTIVTSGTNKATGNIVEKANSIPYYHSDYYTAVEMCRRLYSENSYVNSGLASGTMWDMMVKYIQKDGTDITSTNWGNYDNVSLSNLRGYYTNVTSTGETDGFKSTSTLTSTNPGPTAFVILTTGSTEQVMKKNLYDIAGNLGEWTQEVSYMSTISYNLNDIFNSYMLRGGSFNGEYTAYPVCYRGYNFALASDTHRGFRPVLYIK